ncbi:MAG TPA: MarR family transcriptional regulator [Candidatus Dorea gallistercoris]|uniref:MarR family transcriptional regulator n=1 Tax=Candidatus Dorea gallistercoris TaxID=2838542 RepID=A0A9D1R915_9FIRM|nr:MarR family transcriptional regulator [Candidatus Dorea gallistercoris]
MGCNLDKVPELGLMGIVMHRVINRAKGMYQEFDLNASQAGILFSLHQSSAMSQKELAESLNMTPPSITSTIQKMEKGGYIRRKADEKDQRVLRLSLTEKGESCIQSVKQVAEQMRKLIFYEMSEEEIQQFRKFLLRINENLEREV